MHSFSQLSDRKHIIVPAHLFNLASLQCSRHIFWTFNRQLRVVHRRWLPSLQSVKLLIWNVSRISQERDSLIDINCLHQRWCHFVLIRIVRSQHPLVTSTLCLCSTVHTSCSWEAHPFHRVERAAGLRKRCLLLNRGTTWVSRAHAWLACIIRCACVVDSVKLWVGLGRSVKFSCVVFWCIEKLFVSLMTVLVILWIFDIEIWDPAQLTKNISIFANFCIIRHSGPFYFIFFVRIELATWNQRNIILLAERFVKIFLHYI